MSALAMSNVERVEAFFERLANWGTGYREQAGRVAMAILDAATYFNGRMLEAVAGYPRDLTSFPVGWLHILDIPGRCRRTDALRRGLGARQ